MLLPAHPGARAQLYHLLLPLLLPQQAPSSRVPSKVPTQLPELISSRLHHLPTRCLLPTLPSPSKATLSKGTLGKATLGKATLSSRKVLTLPKVILPSLRLHTCNHAAWSLGQREYFVVVHYLLFCVPIQALDCSLR